MTKICALCQTSTAHELVVHEECHRQEVAEQTKACVECERDFAEVDASAAFDAVLDELRRRHLPHYRVTA